MTPQKNNDKKNYSINCSYSLRNKFFKIYQQSKELVNNRIKAGTHLPTFLNLLCDIFCSLYLPNPSFEDENAIHPAYLMNHHILKNLLVSDDYQNLRKNCAFSSVDSFNATQVFAQKLLKDFTKSGWKKLFLKYKKIFEKIDFGRTEIKKKRRFTITFFLKAFFMKLLPLKKGLGSSENADETKNVIKKLTSQTAKNVIKDVDVLNGFVRFAQGWKLKGGGINRIGYMEKMRLAKKMMKNRKLLEFSKIIGKMRKEAVAENVKKIRSIPNEVHSILFGDDLTKIHPSEIVRLSHVDFQYDFYQRYVQSRLMIYKHSIDEGSKKPRGGSIIVCVDTSGSMAGKSDIFAKGIALGLLEIARKKGRNYVSLIFGQKDNIQKYAFDGDNVTIQSPDGVTKSTDFFDGLVDFTTGFLGGYTDFETPLDKALTLIEQHDSYYDADIVFLTDDAGKISDEFANKYNKKKIGKNFRVYGVLIGVEPKEDYIMNKFCDDVFFYKDFMEVPQKIFNTVKGNREYFVKDEFDS